MLRIIIEGQEQFNKETQEFIEATDSVIVELEHSLISVSKWESKYLKAFLSSEEKTKEELFGYLQQMIITPNLDPDVLYKCSTKNLKDLQAYIDSSQSATTFGNMPERRGPGEVITSELIYYWMVSFNIPFECEHWHLNRLFSLIRICNIKNSKPEKVSKAELSRRMAELNARRKKELNTTG